MDDATRVQHEQLAKETNRATWTLLEQAGRTPDDDEQMIHAAHASAYHWRQVGGAEVSARADWLLSHVYAALGQADPAQRYARQSLATCERERFGGFDLAYAYEGMARSAAAGGNGGDAHSWLAKAGQAVTSIEDPEDRQIFMADLAAGPWFGITS